MSKPYNPWEDQAGGDDDELKDETSERTHACFTYALIDCREGMHMKSEGQDLTPFQIAMKCLFEMEKHLVIGSDNDQLGIIFYGTKAVKNTSGIKGVYIFQDLDFPSAICISNLKKEAGDDGDFTDKIGAGAKEGSSPLGDALLVTNMSFNVKVPKNQASTSHQRIWIFTNDDNPNAKFPDEQQKAIQNATDSAELNREIALFHLSSGKKFDRSLYFEKLLPNATDEAAPDVDSFDDLMNEVRKKLFKKRRLASLEFTIVEGSEGEDPVQMSIELFATIMSTKKPAGENLEASTNTKVNVQTKMLCSETGNYLTEDQIKTYVPYGGEKVMISREEMKEVKTVCDKGILLLGFKPLETLEAHFNTRSSYFLYPTEDSIQGSTVAFAALCKAMLAQKKCAIARLTVRDETAPLLAALIAQEHCDDDESGEVYDGMAAVVLPYQDDLRDFRIDPTVSTDKAKANEDQISVARDLVKSINLNDFCSDQFCNPVIQKHYAAVQALALEEADIDFDDKVDDEVQPESFAPFQSQIERFDSAFADIVNPVPASKRKAAGAGGAKAKKPKVDAANLDWAALKKDDKVKKQTVAVLKNFCKDKGLETSGKKADLVERVEEYLDAA